MDGDRHTLQAFFQELQDDPMADTIVDFPNPDVQYSVIRILPPANHGMPGARKRPRENQSEPQQQPQQETPPPPRVPLDQQFDNVGDALRGEAKKRLVCVNLKIPLEIWPRWAPLYPPLWEGPNAADNWKAAFAEYITFHRVDITLQHKREQFFAAKQEFLSWLTRRPAGQLTKDDWFVPFQICSRLFALTVFATQGFAAENKAWQGATKAFEKGFVDYEELFKVPAEKDKQGNWGGGRRRGQGNQARPQTKNTQAKPQEQPKNFRPQA